MYGYMTKYNTVIALILTTLEKINSHTSTYSLGIIISRKYFTLNPFLQQVTFTGMNQVQYVLIIMNVACCSDTVFSLLHI